MKWQSHSDYVYGKLNQCFYAFSQFCHFKPNTAQKHHFIRSLIKPVFTYNFELWYNSATKKQINRMTGQFKEGNFDLDMDFYLRIMIKKTAFKFISDPSHILQVVIRLSVFII